MGRDQRGGRTTDGRALVLVVEDDVRLARMIARAIRGPVDVWIATTKWEALRVLERESVSGAILGIRRGDLPDEEHAGLDLLEHIRSSGSLMPVMLLTGLREWELLERANQLGAEYVLEPFAFEPLRRLAAAAIKHQELASAVREAVAKLVAELGLTPCQVRVLPLVLCGWRNDAIATAFAVGRECVKSHRARIVEQLENLRGSDRVAELERSIRLATLGMLGIVPERLNGRGRPKKERPQARPGPAKAVRAESRSTPRVLRPGK